jgi:hypothetical protein
MPSSPHPSRSHPDAEDGRPQGSVVGGAAGSDGAPETAPDHLLRFEPDRIVWGIVYHMLDEGLAREVAPDSMRNALARLRRRGVRLSIRHGAWLAMNNHDRLEWLLAESRTVPLLREDGAVLLGSRDA